MSARLVVPQALLDREQVRRRGLRELVRRAWPMVDSAPLRWGWHLDAVCEHLEAVQRRALQDLVINVPPGCSKSLITSVLFPAWVWTIDPTHRWLAASYSDKVVLRDARRHRTLVTSDWYRERWPEVQVPRDATASTAVTDWYTTAGGMRYSNTTGGQWTGQHGDTLLVDDPLDPQGADLTSGVELEKVLRWWHETMPTRFRDQASRARVVVMQRLHERDLTAEFSREGATVLCLPMRFEPAHPHRWARDPRTREGELLAPDRFPEGVVRGLEAALGPRAAAAQLQQRPSPAAGGIFRAEWLGRRWVELPPGGTWAQSWDLAFKESADSSFVVGQVWYQAGADFYLVDQDRARRDFASTCTAMKALSARYPKAMKKLVEAKANGPAVASALKRELAGIELVEPEGGKVARAHACEALFAAGNVLLPDEHRATYPDGRRGAPWLPEYLHELLTFPAGAADDQVDATTQALNHLAPRLAARMAAAMERAFGG